MSSFQLHCDKAYLLDFEFLLYLICLEREREREGLNFEDMIVET